MGASARALVKTVPDCFNPKCNSTESVFVTVVFIATVAIAIAIITIFLKMAIRVSSFLLIKVVFHHRRHHAIVVGVMAREGSLYRSLVGSGKSSIGPW